jgi:hypothetical protein
MIIDAHVHHTWADPDDPPWALIEETFTLAEQAGISKIGLLGTYSFHGYDPTQEGITQCNTHAAKRARLLSRLEQRNIPSFASHRYGTWASNN